MARCGGQVLADAAPSGGRHVFVVFAAALPWRELRDLCRAVALRFPAVDPAPMASLGGQVSPPGSRHKRGGWGRSRAADQVRAAIEHPSGPPVWAALLAEFAAELQQADQRTRAAAATISEAELDDAGVRGCPASAAAPPSARSSTRRPARGSGTGHVTRAAEARMAVSCAAAAGGWCLADVRSAAGSQVWPGLAGLYHRRSEPARMDRLLAYEWRSHRLRDRGEKRPPQTQ